jgi:hypothetical protein
VQHGIFAAATSAFDPVSLQSIYAELVEEFGADTPSRRMILEEMAMTWLRLARAKKAERGLIDEGIDPPVLRSEEDEAVDALGLSMVPRLVSGSPAALSASAFTSIALLGEYSRRLMKHFVGLRDALRMTPTP